ncbi:MAG: hypothetical protein ACTSUQ_00715, partial [Candidatus Freyarchaeota archaeon]
KHAGSWKHAHRADEKPPQLAGSRQARLESEREAYPLRRRRAAGGGVGAWRRGENQNTNQTHQPYLVPEP